MSEMAPESGGGGIGRPLGVPVLVWVAGAAILVYFLFFRGKQSAGSPSTSGGGGTITTGDTTIQSGAVKISVSQKGPSATGSENEDQDQPTPRPGGGGGGGGGGGPPPRQHKRKAVKIPSVAGKHAADAISDLEAAGLEVVTSPFRNSKNEYVATGTIPPAGTSVPEGTRVTLRVRLSRTGRAPAKPRKAA